jgi:hypothetical protein
MELERKHSNLLSQNKECRRQFEKKEKVGSCDMMHAALPPTGA